MKRYFTEYDCYNAVLVEHPYGPLVEYKDVEKLQEEVEHLREYTDHLLVEFSKLPCLPEDLENLREANTHLAEENEYLKKELQLYVATLSGAAKAASIFQCGGKYAKRANVTLGTCCVVGGIEWMDREIQRLESEISGWKNKWECAIEMAAQAENKLVCIQEYLNS